MSEKSSSTCIAALLGLLVAAPPAWAGCAWADLAKEETRVATVRSDASRVHMHGNDGDRQEPYVNPGDVVLTGPSRGAFTCAGLGGTRRATTIGWLPSSALVQLPEAVQSPSDWIGDWVGDQRITISPDKDGGLQVQGNATWGRNHVGEVSGHVRPVGKTLAFTMGEGRTLAYEEGDAVDCRIRLWRRGPYLLAPDNMQCGGVNVSFSGFYVRVP